MTTLAKFFRLNCDPNPEQRAFIRKLAGHCHYLLLGDTSHTHAPIALFVMNLLFVDALRTGGMDRMYVESPPYSQYFYDRIGDMDVQSKGQRKIFTQNLAASNIASAREREKILLSFRQAAIGVPDFKFMAADMRDFHLILEMIRTARTLEQTPGASTAPDNLPREIYRLMSDDRRTAEKILESGDSGAVFFGAGHFCNSASIAGHESDLRGFLEKTEKPVCTINIYESASQKKERDRKKGSIAKWAASLGASYNPAPPDAELFVFPPRDAPHGIRILNPAFQPFLDAAL